MMTETKSHQVSNQPSEPEFEQAYTELVNTLQDSTLFEKHPELEKVIPVVSIPERVVQFRVTWEDDEGNLQVNRGYRVQFNSALGPYKGGLRFHPTVNLSVLKFLGFEQIFKNALTGLNMGGGKGGADFNPKGRSDNEIRRFCVAFMTELQRHIGPDTDVPAGDINVGAREIGYLFGTYKKLRNAFQGVLTGKGLTWGGSLIRPEATGYGLVYFVEKMVEYATNGKETMKGKRVAISGSGNVAQFTALKVIELDGIVVSLSDSKGAFVATSLKGFTAQQVAQIADIKLQRKPLSTLEETFESECAYFPDVRPWKHVGSVDIALPCATQNELSGEEASVLVANGCRFFAEGSNMGSTLDAIEILESNRLQGKNVFYAPGKASNCGGVAVSGLEMAQNSQRTTWTAKEVDAKLKKIMVDCFNTCIKTAIDYSSESSETSESCLPSLVKGANIAGFVKIANAMKDNGDFW